MRRRPEIDALLARAAAEKPAVDVTADDGVRHQLWVIDDEATIAALTSSVDALPALYIADGHHRSAAALRVAHARGEKDGYFLAVLLPQHEMTILDYNRVLRDLNGKTPEEVLREIGRRYAVEPSDGPAAPARADEVGMFLGGRWHRLALKPEIVAEAAQSSDPVARLPVTLLAKNVIEPIFGIIDPRRDKRIDFVGGGRGSRSSSGSFPPARWPSLSRSLRPRCAISWRSPTPARSCRRNRPGSNPSWPTGWSATCWTDRRERATGFSDSRPMFVSLALKI